MQPAGQKHQPAVKQKYELDDAVWIELQGKPGMHEGRVVFGFRIATEPADFYIIRLNDRAYPFLEVRDPLLMAPETGKRPPIAFGKTSAPVPFC